MRVRAQRLGLASGRVVGPHQLINESFAQRIRDDEPFEVGHRPLVLSRRDQRLGPLLGGDDAKFFQSGRVRERPPVVGELAVRLTAPQVERGVDEVDRLRRWCAAGLLEQALEADRVERAVVDGEAVARILGHDLAVAQRQPQTRDVGHDGAAGAIGRVVRPDRVDQAIDETTFPARRAAIARMRRCCGPPSATASPSPSRASTGPSSPNSRVIARSSPLAACGTPAWGTRLQSVDNRPSVDGLQTATVIVVLMTSDQPATAGRRDPGTRAGRRCGSC